MSQCMFWKRTLSRYSNSWVLFVFLPHSLSCNLDHIVDIESSVLFGYSNQLVFLVHFSKEGTILLTYFIFGTVGNISFVYESKNVPSCSIWGFGYVHNVCTFCTLGQYLLGTFFKTLNLLKDCVLLCTFFEFAYFRKDFLKNWARQPFSTSLKILMVVRKTVGLFLHCISSLPPNLYLDIIRKCFFHNISTP